MAAARGVSRDVADEVEDFLVREAELLDAGRYNEWLGTTTDDVRYVLPVRVTRERAAPSDILDGMCHIDDDRTMLELRVQRIESEYAWAEDPPSRTRHFVSNIRVRPHDGEAEEVTASSNLLLYRTRSDAAKYDLLSGEREDLLRRVAGEWRLAARTVMLDQTTVLTHNLSMIL
jgi:3-phenylpropionate/cinnamic acid dioxygenase small subunit